MIRLKVAAALNLAPLKAVAALNVAPLKVAAALNAALLKDAPSLNVASLKSAAALKVASSKFTSPSKSNLENDNGSGNHTPRKLKSLFSSFLWRIFFEICTFLFTRKVEHAVTLAFVFFIERLTRASGTHLLFAIANKDGFGFSRGFVRHCFATLFEANYQESGR